MKVFICFALISLTFSTQVISETKQDLEDASHLLQRLTYGPRPGDVEVLAKKGKLGRTEWLESQMDPLKIPDNKVDEELKVFPSLAMNNTERLAAYPKAKMLANMDEEAAKGKKLPKEMYEELVAQKLIRAVESERQLQEVMTDFWYNHFNVDFNKGEVKYYIASYERDAIRPNVFGKFRTLLGAVAKDPAMLFYLDGYQSVRDFTPLKKNPNKKPKGINENYARELMELHTLGVDGGYNQNDIREVARALTGWTIEKPQVEGIFVFRQKTHDDGPKKIMSLYLPEGGGITDGEKVLDYLASRPETAKFIAKKLCIKFISDTPPESAIKKVADEFIITDGDLRAVYRKLFSLDEFWDKKTRNAKVKSPLEFVVSSVRALNGDIQAFSLKKNQLVSGMDKMGQTLYKCQPPTGFKSTADFWVNPGALVNRIQLGIALASDRVAIVTSNLGDFKTRMEKSESLENAIQEANAVILQNRLSDGVKLRLLQELNSEEKVQAQGTNKDPKTAIPVAKLVGLMLGSPEFQRR